VPRMQGRRDGQDWVCRHCGVRMASSSYMPTPPAAVRRELAEVLAKAEGTEEAVAEKEPEELAEEEIPRMEKAEKPRKKKE